MSFHVLSRAAVLSLMGLVAAVAAPSAHALAQKMPSCTVYTGANVPSIQEAPGAVAESTTSHTVYKLSASTAPGSAGTPVSPITYQWGNATWNEPAIGCKTISQTLDFWPATAGDPSKPHPTIVYFHPNGATSHTQQGSFLYNNVIMPATGAGFNVVSVEFRHPVMDQYLAPTNGGKVPHLDTGLAIQWLRANATLLKISTNNIFAFGYSRGSLSLWQALQPDLGGGTTGKPSSRVSAYVGYQSQSTYQCDRFSQLFLDPTDPATPAYMDQCHSVNPYESQFGSAVDSVKADSVPVKLQYAEGFSLKTGSKTAIQRLGPVELTTNWEEVHYPDFGIALYNAYKKAGNPRMAYPQQYIPLEQAFLGWQQFIMPLLQPSAN